MFNGFMQSAAPLLAAPVAPQPTFSAVRTGLLWNQATIHVHVKNTGDVVHVCCFDTVYKKMLTWHGKCVFCHLLGGGTCCRANRCAGCRRFCVFFNSVAQLEAFMSSSDENRGRKSQQKTIMWVVILNRDLIDFEGRTINTHSWSPSTVNTP